MRALPGEESRDVLANRSAVEHTRAVLCNPAQCARQCGIAEKRTRRGRDTVRQVKRFRGVVQRLGRLGNVVVQTLRHGKAALRISDGGRKCRSQRDGAVLCQRFRPRAHGARDRHAQCAARRNAILSSRAEEVRRRERTRPAAAIERHHFMGACRVYERERVTAHAIHVGPHHRQHSCHRYGSVDCVATVAKHFDAGRARERMIGTDCGLHAHHIGTIGGGQLRHSGRARIRRAGGYGDLRASAQDYRHERAWNASRHGAPPVSGDSAKNGGHDRTRPAAVPPVVR